MKYNDDQIIEAIKQEGTRAKEFEQFYLVQRQMIRFARSKYKLTEEERESAYTDSALSLAQYIIDGQYEQTAKLKTLLSTIFHRKCVHLVHKKEIKRERVNHNTAWVDELPGLSATSKQVIHSLQEAERNASLQEKIAQLGEKCRAVLIFFYFEGMSLQKIAERTGYKDAGTVKSKKYKCQKSLLKFFPENFDWRI